MKAVQRSGTKGGNIWKKKLMSLKQTVRKEISDL